MEDTTVQIIVTRLKQQAMELQKLSRLAEEKLWIIRGKEQVAVETLNKVMDIVKEQKEIEKKVVVEAVERENRMVELKAKREIRKKENRIKNVTAGMNGSNKVVLIDPELEIRKSSKLCLHKNSLGWCKLKARNNDGYCNEHTTG